MDKRVVGGLSPAVIKLDTFWLLHRARGVTRLVAYMGSKTKVLAVIKRQLLHRVLRLRMTLRMTWVKSGANPAVRSAATPSCCAWRGTTRGRSTRASGCGPSAAAPTVGPWGLHKLIAAVAHISLK
jgi:hypothetical protein